ncbi:MAG: tetratricopeptide repeat protein [Candidatus Kariarchaeaceae archaeon]|jgi:tetratricopeptide (TPR) repeat protein
MSLAQSQVNYHNELIEQHPIDWLNWSRMYSGDPYKARFCLLNSLDSPFTSAREKFVAYSGLGRINCELGNHFQALYNFQRSIDYSPNRTADWNDLKNFFGDDSMRLIKMSTYDIITEFRLDVTYPLTWVVIGINYLNTRQSGGRYQMGIRCFIKALQKDPLCMDAWKGLFKTYQEQGNECKAVAVLKKIGEIKASYAC